MWIISVKIYKCHPESVHLVDFNGMEVEFSSVQGILTGPTCHLFTILES